MAEILRVLVGDLPRGLLRGAAVARGVRRRLPGALPAAPSAQLQDRAVPVRTGDDAQER